jgi:pyrroline-5-carboxylate reductase
LSRLENPVVALIGAGQMGGALARGWAQAVRLGGGLTLVVQEPNFDPALAAALEEAGAELNPPQPGPADVLVLAVKPSQFHSAAMTAKAHLGPDTLCVSVMAGVTLMTLTRVLGTDRIVRAMPNTPGQIGKGVTAYVAGAGCSGDDVALAELLLSPLGPVEKLDAERLMDVVTAVSGSGPAYVFLLAEALAAAAELEGLPKDVAERLARQTVAGAGVLMLESGQAPGQLRKAVTSPNGTTAAALDVLMGVEGLGPLVRRAIIAAAERSRQLGRESE